MTDYKRLPVPTEILALADPDSMIRKTLEGGVLAIPVVHESDPAMTPAMALVLVLGRLIQLRGTKP